MAWQPFCAKPTPVSDRTRTPLLIPETLEDDGILIGWSLEHEYRFPPIGFHYGNERFTPAKGFLNPVIYEREGHLMTIAPTGAGKGTGCIIPTLLRHQGPVIVIDPKGENAAVTARRRKELGQKVVILDPLDIVEGETDRLNPFDLLDRDSPSLTDDVAMLINILVPDDIASKDRFWVSRGQQLLIGLTLHLIIDHTSDHHHPAALKDIVNQGPKRLGEIAEAMMKSEHPDVRSIASNMLIPAPETFGGILSYAQDAISFMRGDLVAACTKDSTFSFDEITRGDPLSLYLVIPSEKLESHGPLLKLWIGSLIAAITRRQAAPPQPTLFILDEAAQLGPLPQLRQAITLLRGYGLQTWSFWQDVSQLQRLYPADWETMVNNCKVLQAFGSNNMNAARGVASLTGYPRPWEVLDLDFNEMILLIGGDEAVIAQRPDYLKDPIFRGMYDSNPRHRSDIDIMPKPQKPQRIYSRPPKPLRQSAGDPMNPPIPLWSKPERNAMNEVVAVHPLEGAELREKISVSLKRGKLKEWPVFPLIPGKWEDVRAPQAVTMLAELWPKLVPNFGLGLKGIDMVRRLSLPFYPDSSLCEAHCRNVDGFAGYLTWIATKDTCIHLTGSSPPIHNLNYQLPLKLEDADMAKSYLKFFCLVVHGSGGAFQIVESLDEVRFESGAEKPELSDEVVARIKPCEVERVEGEKEGDKDGKSKRKDGSSDSGWKVKATVQYANALFESTFMVVESGMVQMLDDEPIIDDLPLLSEVFEDGMRIRRRSLDFK